ncbi:MAG: response regulator [Blastocatellia bacterium]|nr:response regulator [Blastocatellia bacterium]
MEEPKLTLRALVIDDSRVMRGMVMQTLKQTELAEFEFSEASTGNEALDKFDAEQTEIIFCDWNMPGMNGIEFARQIRSMHWANHIPVVMITSESADGKQQDAFNQARITCYITKPFTTDEIREKLLPVIDGIAKKKEQTKPTVAAKPVSPKPSGGFFTKLMGG